MQGIIISFEYSPWCPLILLKYKFLKKMEFQDEKIHFQEIQFLRPSLIVKVTKKKKEVKNRNICLCITNIIGLL